MRGVIYRLFNNRAKPVKTFDRCCISSGLSRAHECIVMSSCSVNSGPNEGYDLDWRPAQLFLLQNKKSLFSQFVLLLKMCRRDSSTLSVEK